MNRSLRGEDEKSLKTNELEPALEAVALLKGAAWLIGAPRALGDLDDAQRAELDEAVDAVFTDTMVVRRAQRWRRAKPHDDDRGWEPYSAYSPEWWDQEVDRLFARLQSLQEQARLLLGRPATTAEFLKVRHVPAAVRGLATVPGLPVGEEIVLDVPTGHHDDSPLLTFRHMVFRGETPGGGAERDAPGVHPMLSLLALTVRVQSATGCRQWEALGYLLCDEVPWVPAIEVQKDSVLRSIAIRVRHPEVPVDVVAAAYKDARSRLGARRRTLQKITTGWPAKVFEFVTEWEQSHPGRLRWLPIYAAFSTRYPAATYSNPASLRETFYRERKRRRQEAHARARA